MYPRSNQEKDNYCERDRRRSERDNWDPKCGVIPPARIVASVEGRVMCNLCQRGAYPCFCGATTGLESNV
jgi:hypothetical protein